MSAHSTSSGMHDNFWITVGKNCLLEDGSGLNCKVLFGEPKLLREAVDRLVRTVAPGSPIMSADDGSAPLAALMAERLESPFWVTRIRDAHERISLGVSQDGNHPWLSGRTLRHGNDLNRLVVVDDLMGSGTKTTRLQRLLLSEGIRMRRVLVMFAYREEAPTAARALGKDVKIRVMQSISSDMREFRND